MNDKTAAELEREKIKVTTNKDESGDEEIEKEEEKETEEETTEEETEEIEETDETESDEKEEDEKKTKEENEEDKPNVEKLQKTIERLQKRIDKKTGREKELEKELNTAKAQLEAKLKEGEVPLTKETVEAEAEKIANAKLAEKHFEEACDKLNKDAAKIDKNFNKKVWAMAEDIGPIPGHMIGILEELDNGGAVLNYLTDNIDDAEEIYKLTPGRMASRLAKISLKLNEKKKKPISKVPEPPEHLGGNGQVTTAFDPTNTKISDKEWIEKRNKQVAERREAKLKAM